MRLLLALRLFLVGRSIVAFLVVSSLGCGWLIRSLVSIRFLVPSLFCFVCVSLEYSVLLLRCLIRSRKLSVVLTFFESFSPLLLFSLSSSVLQLLVVSFAALAVLFVLAGFHWLKWLIARIRSNLTVGLELPLRSHITNLVLLPLWSSKVYLPVLPCFRYLFWR